MNLVGSELRVADHADLFIQGPLDPTGYNGLPDPFNIL
jgi:hypothetical protein